MNSENGTSTGGLDAASVDDVALIEDEPGGEKLLRRSHCNCVRILNIEALPNRVAGIEHRTCQHLRCKSVGFYGLLEDMLLQSLPQRLGLIELGVLDGELVKCSVSAADCSASVTLAPYSMAS